MRARPIAGLRPTLGRTLEAGLLRATTIRVRLILAFSALLLLLLAVAGLAAWRLNELNRVAADNLRTEHAVTAWLGEIRATTVALTALARSDDSALGQALLPQVETAGARLAQWQRQVEALAATPQPPLTQARDEFLDAATAILDRRRAGRLPEAVVLLETQLQPRGESYAKVVARLADGAGRSSAGSTQASADRGLVLLALACVAAGLLQFLVCWLITTSIVRPIRVASKIARKVANGDLTVAVHAEGRDEGTQLFQSLRDMIGNLRALVTEAADGAHTVSATSALIARGHQDLSQRTEDQTGTLGHTALSLEQLTSTVAQNAENARKAAYLAIGASEVARRGGEAMVDVVSTMTGISESSRRIHEITGVIDAIAFQTNILALNAAVEAARAGDQGRGFAVVAAEVRVLAQRSAAAAREIKALVGDSVGRVDAGTRLVHGAGSTMEEIVVAVEEVTDLIGEIATGSQQQNVDIRQVNAAMAQMSQAVQRNAALVEDATAATDGMNQQAELLLQMLARFKLGAETAPAAGQGGASSSVPPAQPEAHVRRPLRMAAPALPVAPAPAWKTL